MKLIVEGMTCGHCVRAITKALRAHDAEARIDIDPGARTVAIEGHIDAARAIALIEAEGYRVTGRLP